MVGFLARFGVLLSVSVARAYWEPSRNKHRRNVVSEGVGFQLLVWWAKVVTNHRPPAWKPRPWLSDRFWIVDMVSASQGFGGRPRRAHHRCLSRIKHHTSERTPRQSYCGPQPHSGHDWVARRSSLEESRSAEPLMTGATGPRRAPVAATRQRRVGGPAGRRAYTTGAAVRAQSQGRGPSRGWPAGAGRRPTACRDCQSSRAG